MCKLSCEQAGARVCETHELHELPCSARRLGRARMLDVPHGEGRASTPVTEGRCSGCVCRLSSSTWSCEWTERRRVRELSRQAAPCDGALPRLSRSTWRDAGSRRGAVREVPRERDAYAVIDGTRGVRELSCERSPRSVDSSADLFDLPQGGHGERDQGTCDLHDVPHRRSARSQACSAGLRDLSRHRGEHRAEGTSDVRFVPRTAQRSSPSGRNVRELSLEQARGG